MNNYNLDLSECTSLTLISSESCNLNCAYCVIANSIDKKVHNEETQNIKNSFINGSFLHNI